MIRKHLMPAAAALMLACAAPAYAAETCELPGPPPDNTKRPVAPKPLVDPPCYNSETGVSRCSAKVTKAHNEEVLAFNRAIAAHNRATQAYAEDLNAWTRKVSRYSQCEFDLMNAR